MSANRRFRPFAQFLKVVIKCKKLVMNDYIPLKTLIQGGVPVCQKLHCQHHLQASHIQCVIFGARLFGFLITEFNGCNCSALSLNKSPSFPKGASISDRDRRLRHGRNGCRCENLFRMRNLKKVQIPNSPSK